MLALCRTVKTKPNTTKPYMHQKT